MSEEIEIIFDTCKVPIYTFRFSNSDKIVHLTQQQLDYIPYLSSLVAHKDDISSIQNNNGEYVLNCSIDYHCFMIILHSITLDQSYILFNDTLEHENILDILHLYDYLCINTLIVPIVKGNSSNHSNSDNENIQIQYRKANFSDKCDTAAQFLIALSKNKYNLNDHKTLCDIFSIVKIIISTSSGFDLRFRYHTLKIVKQYCFSLFSQKQQRVISTEDQIINRTMKDDLKHSYDVNQSFSAYSHDIFGWRALYISKEENHHLKSYPILWMDQSLLPRENHIYLLLFYLQCVATVMDRSNNDEKQKDNQAKSARSGYFNTLSKRYNIDKFKHRSGPKTQKHR